jgi:N-acetylglutamate synthase-like GNAT family acetyltransferase
MHARLAALSDETAVSALLRAAYTDLMAKDYDPEVLAAALPRMVRANPSLLASGTFYVVESPASSIIACGGWTHAAPGTATQTANLAHLRHFATHPSFARRGIGRRIYHRCLQAAKSSGVTKFQAYSSLNAVPFYAGVGLAFIRTFDLPLGDSVKLPAALMEGEV